jgi:hypothetical protein
MVQALLSLCDLNLLIQVLPRNLLEGIGNDLGRFGLEEAFEEITGRSQDASGLNLLGNLLKDI